MIDKIINIAASPIGKIVACAIFIFVYYFVWTIIVTILFNERIKLVLFYLPRNCNAKRFVETVLLLCLFIGFNIIMYLFGLYDDPNTDYLFLVLLSLLFSVMIISMMEIMKETSGVKEFYNMVIAFIVTIIFLSPTKGLLTLDVLNKIYLLIGLLVTFLLFNCHFIKKWLDYIDRRFTNLISNWEAGLK